MRRPLAIAAVLVAALAGCGGEESGTGYGAAFQAPSGVEEGDEIVIGGKEVGEVEKVETKKLNTLEFDAVEFRIDEAGPRLYRNVRLVARGDSVRIDPGDAERPPLVEGNIVPMTQTASERR